jgi:hypothetical protein
MRQILTYVVLGFGGLICVLNFYLSLLRYPVFLRRGGKKEEYRHVSGFPLIGSALVAAALVFGKFDSWIFWSGVVIALLDTGGIHSFLATMAWFALRDRANQPLQGTPAKAPSSSTEPEGRRS